MSTESDNVMRWDRRSTGHYEVWYTTFNHLETRTGFWIRYTLESPLPKHGDPYCQLWFAFFDYHNPENNIAINRKFPIDELEATDQPFMLQIGESTLYHGGLRGKLSGDSHHVSWDLSFDPSIFTHRHLPDLIYTKTFADTKVLSPNLMVNFNGTIEVDGRSYIFTGDPGCQTHLWGRKHAHAWAWSHCNTFREDPTACLETLTVRLKRLGFVSPPMTFLSLYLGSEVYHFRQFSTLLRTRGWWETGLYKFRARGNRVKIDGEMRCRLEDLIRTPYADPDGEASFCHNSEIADCSMTVWTRRSYASPFRKLCRLTARGSAHFEYGSRIPDGRVPRRHITVP